MRSKWIVIGAIGVVGATSAEAQTCIGHPSFAAGSIQLGGGVEFADDLTTLGVGVNFGRQQGLFGGASIGRASLDDDALDIDESATIVGLNLGYQTTIMRTGRTQFCPYGDVVLQFGPSAPGIDVSGQLITFGGRLGGTFTGGPNLEVVPTAGLALAIARVEFDFEDNQGFDDIDESETGGMLDAGVGFVFNRRIGILPYLRIPLGFDNSDTAFGLRVIFTLPN